MTAFDKKKMKVARASCLSASFMRKGQQQLQQPYIRPWHRQSSQWASVAAANFRHFQAHLLPTRAPLIFPSPHTEMALTVDHQLREGTPADACDHGGIIGPTMAKTCCQPCLWQLLLLFFASSFLPGVAYAYNGKRHSAICMPATPERENTRW